MLVTFRSDRSQTAEAGSGRALACRGFGEGATAKDNEQARYRKKPGGLPSFLQVPEAGLEPARL